MGDKYLNRKNDDEDDEERHITEHSLHLEDSIGSYDPMDVKARTIVFSKELADGSKDQVVKQKSEKFKDQINNTNQYLKFINAHLEENKVKVAKIKEAERRFREEIEFLQNNPFKPREELDKINYKYITENDTKALLAHLENERNAIWEKLKHQEQQIEKTRQELRQKDEQLLQIQKEHEAIVKKHATSADDPIAIIKEELVKLGITDNSAKILGAVNSLESLINAKKRSE